MVKLTATQFAGVTAGHGLETHIVERLDAMYWARRVRQPTETRPLNTAFPSACPSVFPSSLAYGLVRCEDTTHNTDDETHKRQTLNGKWSGKRVSANSGRDVEGSGGHLTDALLWRVPGRSEEKHGKSRDILWQGWDTNTEPPEYESGMTTSHELQRSVF